ncbi:MAG: ATP-binding protein [Planctomycetes bacterium]|nr:ATP-binding protein [Planctomycetota bacterium]
MLENTKDNPALPSESDDGCVLVVDDDPGLRAVLSHGLEAEGFEVITAEMPSQAWAILEERQNRVGVILLDLVFAEESGEDMLEGIHNISEEISVIIISGRRDEETVMHLLRNGACDFIEKPFRVSDVAAIIRRAMRRKTASKVDHKDMTTANPTVGWVELTAPSDFEFLTRMQRFSQILFGTHLPRDAAEDLRMTMEEMGRNAIEWGNRFDKAKQFHISYCFFNDRVVIKFEDEGEGFKPGSVPDPSLDPHEHLKKREQDGKRPGGFGVYLVQNIMDEVVYSERGNVVLMTKFF